MDARIVRLSAVVLLAAAGLGGSGPSAVAHEPGAPPARRLDASVSASPRLAVIKPAPDFVLRDTSGGLVRLSSLRGRVVLMSFIYTSCPDACPLLTRRMALLQERLARAGLQRGTHFLSITVDPERDSAEVLARYAKGAGARTDRWQFLRDAPQLMRPVLAAWDEWTRPRSDGSVDHPARLYLVDRAGAIREIYSLSFFDERQAFLDIRSLLRESRH